MPVQRAFSFRRLLGFAVLGAVLLSALALCAALFEGYKGGSENFRRFPPSELAMHPEWTEIAGLQEVSFTTAEGTRIAGWSAPSRNRAAVIILHGTNADRADMLPETAMLAEAGFGVLAYDSPGYGLSEGRAQWGAGARSALSAAVDWLAARPDVDPGRIGGLGFSMGGLTLAEGAAIDKRLRAIALLSAPCDISEQQRWEQHHWGTLGEWASALALHRYASDTLADVQPRDAIAAIAPRPVFIIGGSSDPIVPESTVRSLYDHAGQPKQIWIIPGAMHGTYMQVAPKAFSERVAGFFTQSLLTE